MASFINIQRIIFLCFCFFCQTAFAGYWYGSFDIGAGVSEVGKNNTLTLFTSSSPIETNSYIVNRKYRATGLLTGVGGGYRFDVIPKMELALGASASYLSYDSVDGTVHPLVNIAPDFDVMNFNIDAESYLLLFEPAFIFPIECSWRFFLKPSVGVAWNKLSYDEYRTPGSTTVPGPFSFRSRTQTSFAYAPSIGLEYAINAHSSAQIGYQYINAGNVTLGTMQNQETNQHIDAGTLSAHLVIVNILFT